MRAVISNQGLYIRTHLCTDTRVFRELLSFCSTAEIETMHTHSVYYAVSVLYYTAANSIQHGKGGEGRCRSYPLSCDTAALCFDWVKSTLSQYPPPHKPQQSICSEKPLAPH